MSEEVRSSPSFATAEAILAWLSRPEGEALLHAAAQLPPDRLTRLQRLRRQWPPEVAARVVTLLEQRQRGRAKFTQADTLFFTPEGLEQSTGERIAHYRAARFPVGIPTLDACCGIGGDALALSVGRPLLAVDSHPLTALCAALNLQRQGGETSARVLCADVQRLDLARLARGGIAAALFDPSRRVEERGGGRRRARTDEEYQPPLNWLETLRATFPALAVKVSPILEDAILTRFGGRVEFLSDRGECKEAVLWFGPLAEGLPPGSTTGENYAATVLRPSESPATLTAFACDPPPLSPPQAWLYEPDPAVIRAHLVPQMATLLNATLLAPQIAYLTAPTSLSTPFATAYRVLDAFPYHRKTLQQWLRQKGARLVAIKRRGVPLEPEAVRKQLEDAGPLPVVLVLTRLAEKPFALLCEPPPFPNLRDLPYREPAGCAIVKT